MGRGILQIIKEGLDLDFEEKEFRRMARNFAYDVGGKYLDNPRYDKKKVVDSINRHITRFAKREAEVANYVMEELRLLYPEIHKEHPFKIS